MRKILLMCIVAFLWSGLTFAQDRTITGKVVDESGSPIPGVNIAAKGTTRGTTTDGSGNFSLNVLNDDKILVFSFIGYKTVEQIIGNQSIINVNFVPDAQTLNEVVVTALGVEREAKSLGYSVATIKTDFLNQAKVTNFATGLSAKVSGLQINQVDNGVNPSVRIVLRGNRSFLGNNQALVVIDGAQVSSDYINTLNPNDIENVTILKGAGAAALYGSQAANGVLIITTKLGNKSQQPEITFSSTTQLEKVAFLPKLQTRFGSYGGEGPGADVFTIDPNQPQLVAYENQSYGPQYNGKPIQLGRPIYNPRTGLSDSVQTTTYSDKSDEKRKFWNTGLTTQNSLSLSAGTEKSKFYISLQDVTRHSVKPGDKLRRDVVRFNGVTEYGIVKVGYKLNYTVANTDANDYLDHNGLTNTASNSNNVYWSVVNTPNWVPLTKFKDWRNNKFADLNGYYNDFYNNPYWVLDNNRVKISSQDFLGNLELSVKAAKWLTLLGRGTLTNSTYRQNQNDAAIIFASPSLRNPNRYQSGQGSTRGYASDLNIIDRRINLDFLATLNHKIGDFEGSLILGNNIRDVNYTTSSISTTNLLDPSIYNVVYRYGNLEGYNYTSRARTYSFYGDLSLNYKKFAFLHGSLRNDNTSLLYGADGNKGNSSFTYPSADFSFVFSEAIPAIKESSIITFGKITASIAKVGNVSLLPYQNNPAAGIGTPYQKGAVDVVGLSLPGKIVSKGLKPEFTVSREIDLELGLFKNKANFKAAYYVSNTTNQTVPINVSASTGYGTALINSGEMLNKGLEFDLSIIPIQNNNGFKWTIGANFTDILANKPLSIYPGLDQISLQSSAINSGGNASSGASSGGNPIGQSNNTNSFAVRGYNYPSIQTFDWVRDPQGRVVVDAITGLPSRDAQLKNYGQANPKYRLGLTTNLNYKGIFLNVVADYRAGNYVFNQVGQDIEFGGIGYTSAEAGRQRFVYPNSSIKNSDGTYSANTNVTVNEGNYNFWQGLYNTVGGNYVVSGAFWKLREISIGYEVPSSMLKSLKFIKRASISLNGRNLLMWRPKSNKWTDPEYSEDNSNAVGRTSLNQTPPTRIFGFNVTLTF